MCLSTRYSYCPTLNEGKFAFPAEWTFVIGVSGAVAEKTGDKMKDYNDAALLAREAGDRRIAAVLPPWNLPNHFLPWCPRPCMHSWWQA
jgi:hypothetical protein